MTTIVHPDYLPLSPFSSPFSTFICNQLHYQNYPPTHNTTLFKLEAMPTKLRSYRQTWTGRRSPSDANVQKSPYPSAEPRRPKAAASSDLPAGRSTPACYRNQPTTDNMPMARNVSTWNETEGAQLIIRTFLRGHHLPLSSPDIRRMWLKALNRSIAPNVVQHARTVLVPGHQQTSRGIHRNRCHWWTLSRSWRCHRRHHIHATTCSQVPEAHRFILEITSKRIKFRIFPVHWNWIGKQM